MNDDCVWLAKFNRLSPVVSLTDRRDAVSFPRETFPMKTAGHSPCCCSLVDLFAVEANVMWVNGRVGVRLWQKCDLTLEVSKPRVFGDKAWVVDEVICRFWCFYRRVHVVDQLHALLIKPQSLGNLLRSLATGTADEL